MTSKKVIIVLGSPRKNGNSSALAQKASEGIKSMGVEFESFYLHGMDIKPCAACDTCKKAIDKYCITDDDMQILYPKILEAGALLIASPIYWFTVSAQTKLFMDRCRAFLSSEGNTLTGKRIGIILTYGDTDPYVSGAVNALRTFQDAFNYVKAPIIGTVYGSASEAGEIKANHEIMEKAYELGKKLVSS